MTIEDSILQAAHMSEAELKTELAVLLYQKGKLSMGKAAELADTNRIQFQFLLASRQIPVSYDVEELLKDWETIQRNAS
jgi:predicted HTH domain antitoxin